MTKLHATVEQSALAASAWHRGSKVWHGAACFRFRCPTRRGCTPAQRLNQILADTQILDVFYKKHHGLVRGVTGPSIHYTCCSTSTPRNNLTWIVCWPSGFRSLGGAPPPPRHGRRQSLGSRDPDGVEVSPRDASVSARGTRSPSQRKWGLSTVLGDDGTNDLLVSDVIRIGELQCWFSLTIS